MKQTVVRPIPLKELRIQFDCSICERKVWVGSFSGEKSGTITCPVCHNQFQWYAGVIENIEVTSAN